MSDMTADFEERVRKRAYLLWEREGRPNGRADEHWRQAVAELAELEAAEAAREPHRSQRTDAGAADGFSASIPPRSGRPVARRRASLGVGERTGATSTAKRNPSDGSSRQRTEPADASAPSEGARQRRQPSAAARAAPGGSSHLIGETTQNVALSADEYAGPLLGRGPSRQNATR
jgi:DUF2934 family protein